MRRYIVGMLVLISIVTVAAGLIGCSSSDGTGAVVVTEGSSAQTTETSAEAQAPGTRGNPLAVGTTAKVGDWEVTVTAVNTNANDAIAAANEFNDPPVAGSQYVLVTVGAKYVGKESGTFWTDMSYKFYGAAGNTFDSGAQSMAVPPTPIYDAGETFPGASVSGNLLFEVPVDQIEGGAVIMEQSFSFEETRVFFALK